MEIYWLTDGKVKVSNSLPYLWPLLRNWSFNEWNGMTAAFNILTTHTVFRGPFFSWQRLNNVDLFKSVILLAFSFFCCESVKSFLLCSPTMSDVIMSQAQARESFLLFGVHAKWMPMQSHVSAHFGTMMDVLACFVGWGRKKQLRLSSPSEPSSSFFTMHSKDF